ncbi:MAG: iron uptake protein [Pseudomonadota bacterium]
MDISNSIPVYRLPASVLGTYAFCWGLVAFGMALFSLFGLNFHDAESLMMMVGLTVYLIVFLWVFAAKNAVRIGILLAILGAVMTAIAWLIQHLTIGGAS